MTDSFHRLPRPRGDVTLANGVVLTQEQDIWIADNPRPGVVILDGRPQPAIHPDDWKRVPPGEGQCSVWEGDGWQVTIDHVAEKITERMLLHALINTRHVAGGPRSPPIAELKLIRDAFFPPDVSVIHVWPEEADYKNAAEWAYHLWQYPGTWRIAHL